MTQTRSEFGYLDAARGTSAFVVLLAHCVQIFWLRFTGAGTSLNAVSSALSSYAVVVFFLLSGFLITHSIESNIRRNGGFDALGYACARFARIYPPFLVAFVLTVVVYGILEWFALPGRGSPLRFPGDLYAARDIVVFPAREMITSVLMLGGGLDMNGPLWSLYMEVKLYAVFACAYCVGLGVRRLPALLIGILVTVVALRLQPEFCRYAALWLLGCIAYYVMGHRVPGRNIKLWLCGFAALTLAAVGPLTTGEAGWTGAVRELLVAAALICVLVRFRLQVPGGRSVAPYSYTLYVIHFPILLLSQSLLIATGERGVGAAIVASTAAPAVVLLLAWWLGSVERQKQAVQARLETAVRRILSRWRTVAMIRESDPR